MSKRGRSTSEEDDIVVITAATVRTPLFHALKQNISSSWTIKQLSRIEHSNNKNFLRCVIFDSEDLKVHASDVNWLRREFSKCFIIVYQPSAVNDPETRLHYFKLGVNMVAHDVKSILEVMHSAVLIEGSGSLVCPYCDFYNLTEDELWRHTPAYHINCLGKNDTKCPICRDHISRKPLQVHIHDDHGPVARARQGRPIEEQASIRCYSFSLVVCRHPISGHFLLCQEFSGQGFWLPGGAVDAGESYATAALRETVEEAGVDIELKGILRIEHSPSKTGPQGGFYVRQRVIYYAEPKDSLNCVPKSIPDFESAGACWVSLEQMEKGLSLRGNEPLQWARHLADGGIIFPMEILMEKE